MWHDYIDRLVRDRWLIFSHGRYRFTLPTALSYLAGYIRGEGRLLLSKLRASETVWQNLTAPAGLHGYRAGAVDSEVEAFQRVEAVRRHRPLFRAGGVLLYLASILMFCLAFGVTMTPGAILVLAAALLLHEAGHRLGLRVTREGSDTPVQIKTSFGKTLWKGAGLRRQAFSTLLGSLPGIIVGHVLLAFHLIFSIDFLHSAAVIVLAVNFMDILPLLPMDGGRQLQLELVGRFPRSILSFALISAAAFAAGGIHLGKPSLLALGTLILFTIPLQWRNAKALARYQNLSIPENVPLDKRTRLRRTFEVLSE